MPAPKAFRHLSPEPPARAKPSTAPHIEPRPTPDASREHESSITVPGIDAGVAAARLAGREGSPSADLKSRVVDIDAIKAEICRLQEVRLLCPLCACHASCATAIMVTFLSFFPAASLRSPLTFA